MVDANALRWDGSRGHHEVHYLTLTDRGSGVGAWIRYTMLAPLSTREETTCSLWFLAMDPDDPTQNVARKLTRPIGDLVAEPTPFSLQIGDAQLTDRGASGSVDDVAWDLRWEPRLHAFEHVHPLLQRAKIAKTVLTLPHPALHIEGKLRITGRELTLEGAHGGQAHLWGSKHANRWAWAHCDDLE